MPFLSNVTCTEVSCDSQEDPGHKGTATVWSVLGVRQRVFLGSEGRAGRAEWFSKVPKMLPSYSDLWLGGHVSYRKM